MSIGAHSNRWQVTGARGEKPEASHAHRDTGQTAPESVNSHGQMRSGATPDEESVLGADMQRDRRDGVSDSQLTKFLGIFRETIVRMLGEIYGQSRIKLARIGVISKDEFTSDTAVSGFARYALFQAMETDQAIGVRNAGEDTIKFLVLEAVDLLCSGNREMFVKIFGKHAAA